MDFTGLDAAQIHAVMTDAAQADDAETVAACEYELGVRGGWITPE